MHNGSIGKQRVSQTRVNTSKMAARVRGFGQKAVFLPVRSETGAEALRLCVEDGMRILLGWVRSDTARHPPLTLVEQIVALAQPVKRKAKSRRCG